MWTPAWWDWSTLERSRGDTMLKAADKIEQGMKERLGEQKVIKDSFIAVTFEGRERLFGSNGNFYKILGVQ